MNVTLSFVLWSTSSIRGRPQLSVVLVLVSGFALVGFGGSVMVRGVRLSTESSVSEVSTRVDRSWSRRSEWNTLELVFHIWGTPNQSKRHFTFIISERRTPVLFLLFVTGFIDRIVIIIIIIVILLLVLLYYLWSTYRVFTLSLPYEEGPLSYHTPIKSPLPPTTTTRDFLPNLKICSFTASHLVKFSSFYLLSLPVILFCLFLRFGLLTQGIFIL